MRSFAVLLHGRAVDAATELDADGNTDPTVREMMAALTNALLRIDRLEIQLAQRKTPEAA